MRPQESYVYVIQQRRTGYVKIGQSDAPWKRLKELQTGSPLELKIVAIFPQVANLNEALLHKRFAANRLNGEWFDAIILKDFLQDPVRVADVNPIGLSRIDSNRRIWERIEQLEAKVALLLQSSSPSTKESGPRLMRFKNVKEVTGMGRTKIYDLIKKGVFPKPTKIGRASLWHSDAIQAFLMRLVDSKSTQTAPQQDTD